FHGDLQERFEELFTVEFAELGFALLQRLERILPFLGGKPIELLAVDFARPGIGGGHTGREKLAWRERQLIAVFRFGLSKWSVAIHLGAAAPSAGELPIDERDDAAIAAGRRELVGGDDRVDGRGKERGFRVGEREIRLRPV